MTKVINFFGGPAIGKSLAAVKVYDYLKVKSIDCELVREFATELIWQNRLDNLKDQLYVLAEQAHRQLCLLNKVDFIITDSPLVLANYYRKFHENKILENTCFDELVVEIFNKYDNLNIFLKRKTTTEYQQAGRLQNQEDAIKIDAEIQKVLNDNNIPYFEIDRNDIIEFIKTKLQI